jgi:gamma-glutamylcyclotransferase
MSSIVFAYGSNMCSGRFRAYRIEPVGRGRAALLDRYCLVFNKLSKDGSGKATVSPRDGHHVWGVLYEVDDADLARLDKGEGTGYKRSKVTVRTADDIPVEAWVYIATKPITTHELRPYTWYKRFLVEGAEEHLLPPEYITGLREIDAMIDLDSKRHAEKWALPCASSPE